MNYSKNISKAEIAKRLVVSWIVVAIVSFIFGNVLGYTLGSCTSMRYNEEMQTSQPMQSEFVVYGVYDDRVLTEEISFDWSTDNLEFTPLDVAMDEEQQEFVFYLCAGYNLDFTLVMALIEYESNYQADAVSETNDYGLMQINHINHDWLTKTIGVTDYLDPYQNVRAGCFIFRKLFEKYQDADMVLMAYKMGETGASRLWKNGIFSTDYTESIRGIQQKFNEQLIGTTNAGNLESN